MQYAISFDPLTGDLWLGMVGSWIQDYATIIRKGDNLGWPILEGTTCYNGTGVWDHALPKASCDKTGFVEPIIALPHDDAKADQSNCLIGGVVYRANPKSAFYGAYFFFDTITHKLWAATQQDRKLIERKSYPVTAGIFTHLLVDSQGNLLAVDYATGKVWMGDHAELRLGAVPVVPRASDRRSIAPRKVALLGGSGEDAFARASDVPLGIYLMR